jgi:hypothetical protein
MMTTLSRSSDKLSQTWDSAKQDRYRQRQGFTAPVFHCLLDASGSMQEHAPAVIAAYNGYLGWLKRHADPMSLLELALFTHELVPGPLQALGSAVPLSAQTYAPHGGTHLYAAVGVTITTKPRPGQHILIVFSDGQDMSNWEDDKTGKPGKAWDAPSVATILTTLQQEEGWLCVFLGAFQGSLDVGQAMGFLPGNCLEFRSEKLPEAFQRLQQATQRYLSAPGAERKLLAAHGIF